MGARITYEAKEFSDIQSPQDVPPHDQLPTEAQNQLPDCSAITKPADYRADIAEASSCYADAATKAGNLASVSEGDKRTAYENMAARYRNEATLYTGILLELQKMDSNPEVKTSICDMDVLSETENPSSPLNALLQEVQGQKVYEAKVKVCENRYLRPGETMPNKKSED